MEAHAKPRMTGGSHPLPFDKLAPLELERLCLWLVSREGYDRAEHLGEAGSEQGRDVVAWKDGQRVVFQCKRVQGFNAAIAKKEIEKLRALPIEDQPHELVFVVPRTVSVALRAAIRSAWGNEETCQFWVGNELDERVKRHPEVLREFFQLPGPQHTWLKWSLGVSVLCVLLMFAALTRAVPQILLVARDIEERPLSGLRFAFAGIETQKTSATGATELNLPPALRNGRQIKIQLLPAKKSDDWFLVNPQINIPSNSVPAELVLMRRSAFRELAETARDAAGPALGSEDRAAEDKKRALVETAARFGLSADQLETALRSFAVTQNAKDRGIAAYLEGQYFQAENLLEDAAANKEADLGETLRYLGSSQYEQAKYRAAVATFRKALALNAEDPALLAWLGNALHKLAEWAEAEPLMRRALAIDEKSYGPGHPSVATNLSNLTLLLQDTNRLAEAEPLARRALAIDEKSYGPFHPDVARDLNNLALLLNATNRLAEAKPLMARVVTISERCLGKSHPNVATALNNLASLLQDTNRLGEAEPLIRRALRIDERNYGSDHPKVARDLNNLAQLLKATNRLHGAEPLMRRALAIDEKSYGPFHPDVARDLNNLALLLLETNRPVEAESLMRRALAIDEKSYGPDHPKVAIRFNNLALLLHDTNRRAEAEPLMRRALAIAEKSYGPNHPMVTMGLNNLAQLLQKTNRLGEAEPLMRRALAIDEKSYGLNHPNVARDLYNLAQLLKATNRLGRAEPLVRRALAILLGFGRETGHEHPNLRAARANYALLLKEMGKPPAEIEAAIESLTTPPKP